MRTCAAATVITLLVMGVFHQHSVARKQFVDEAAIELIAEGTRLCRLIESERIDNFEQIKRQSRLSIAWIRWAEAGPQPKARVERGPSGPVVVVALPVRWTAAGLPWMDAAYRHDHRIIEIAAPLDRMRPSARPSKTGLQKVVHSTT